MFCFGACVSFIGVYFITGGRKAEVASETEKEEILPGGKNHDMTADIDVEVAAGSSSSSSSSSGSGSGSELVRV